MGDGGGRGGGWMGGTQPPRDGHMRYDTIL